MPSDLQVSNIKDLTGSNTGLSIASDGQVTIAQNNPTLTVGSNATISKSGMLQGKSKNHVASGHIQVTAGQIVTSTNLDLTLTNCTSGSTFICGFNSAMYNNGHTDDAEFDIITNIASGSDTVYPGGSQPPYGAMGTTRINTDWTHRAQFLVLDSLGHSTGNSIRFRMRYYNRHTSGTTTICHNNAMMSFYVLEII